MNLARAVCLVLLVAGLPAAAAAFVPVLPAGTRVLADETRQNDSYALPTGPFADGAVPTELFPGQVTRQSWQIMQGRTTPAQILAPIRAQLETEGFEVVFACSAQECGGFDFRFQTDVLPAPDMFIDLRNFRFLAARRGEDEAVGVLVSRSRSAAYVQVISAIAMTAPSSDAAPGGSAAPADGASVVSPATAAPTGSIEGRLLENGYVVLEDLDFAPGSASLGTGPHASLVALAAFLTGHAEARVALVGHSDTVGSGAANLRLSEQRAEAVRVRLVETYDVPPGQLTAHGAGFLSPRASNLTPAGREANRRVEAVLTALDGN